MSDLDLEGDAWRVPPGRYLADRPPEFDLPAAPASRYLAMRDGCRLAVDVLNAAFRRALEDASIRRRLEENTLESLAGTAADIRGRAEADGAVWGGFIRRRGLRVE